MLSSKVAVVEIRVGLSINGNSYVNFEKVGTWVKVEVGLRLSTWIGQLTRKMRATHSKNKCGISRRMQLHTGSSF